MRGAIDRRLAVLEKLRPTNPQRVVIIMEDDPVPFEADFAIRLVAATAENMGAD